jgi:hypothetical protein
MKSIEQKQKECPACNEGEITIAGIVSKCTECSGTGLVPEPLVLENLL